MFTFRFVSVFLSLYYYAFAMQDKDAAYLRMAVTIFILMSVGQWWSSFSSICIPALVHRTLLYYTKLNVHNTNRKIYRAREYFDNNFNDNGIGSSSSLSALLSSSSLLLLSSLSSLLSSLLLSLSSLLPLLSLLSSSSLPSLLSLQGSRAAASSSSHQAASLQASHKLDKRTEYLEHARSCVWEEATLSTYSTFTDYNQLIIQLGFVLLFAQVFPLAPLIALTNNLIQIRLDAYKICYTRQRPIAQKTSGVGN